jgi:uncharacterized protein (TIGR03435 family)
MAGVPEWTRSERYDCVAKAAEVVIPANLPTKLRERRIGGNAANAARRSLQTGVRRESKEVPVYALAVAKGGPKMQKSKLDEKDCNADVHLDLPYLLEPRPQVQRLLTSCAMY